jgi:hypothetical protein
VSDVVLGAEYLSASADYHELGKRSGLPDSRRQRYSYSDISILRISNPTAALPSNQATPFTSNVRRPVTVFLFWPFLSSNFSSIPFRATLAVTLVTRHPVRILRILVLCAQYEQIGRIPTIVVRQRNEDELPAEIIFEAMDMLPRERQAINPIVVTRQGTSNTLWPSTHGRK